MKWNSLKESQPPIEFDEFGNPRLFLLGSKCSFSRLIHLQVSYINEKNEIIEWEHDFIDDMTTWTHWARIEDIPNSS
jgi:hypothetical protein